MIPLLRNRPRGTAVQAGSDACRRGPFSLGDAVDDDAAGDASVACVYGQASISSGYGYSSEEISTGVAAFTTVSATSRRIDGSSKISYASTTTTISA